jgi:uncharacterized protein YbjT (DUF2867 family)
MRLPILSGRHRNKHEVPVNQKEEMTRKPPWKSRTLFCYNLPSEPRPDMGTILVTGATGYIGGRLVPELIARGYRVRVMVREPLHIRAQMWPQAEVVVADALDMASLKEALKDVSVAYYLIHSMLLGPEEFARADKQAASNFRTAAEEMEVGRIIYLGGLGDIRSRLSDHLRSRMEVAEELSKGIAPVTILRAAVIIGSGSASYEILKGLVSRLPVIPVPPFARTKCQPIGIRDVIKNLVGVLEKPETSGRTFDIGGQDILTYEDMAKIMADVLGKRRIFFPLLFWNLRLYSYLTSLITPVPAPITRALMEGLRNEVVCRDDSIKQYLPFIPISIRTAIVRALTREEQDRVRTRWSDAYPPAYELAMKMHEMKETPNFTASSSLVTSKDVSKLFASLCRIGGAEGWFTGNWMWRLRGAIDRILQGVGSARGRRHLSGLEVNDVVDFWRVEDLRLNERLLLRSEMRLPGKAWLEFTIAPRASAAADESVGGSAVDAADDDARRAQADPGKQSPEKHVLTIKAYYYTKSFLGRLYWYMFLPFHHFIFKGLIKRIEKRS